jgi:hypothetical protein
MQQAVAAKANHKQEGVRVTAGKDVESPDTRITVIWISSESTTAATLPYGPQALTGFDRSSTMRQ